MTLNEFYNKLEQHDWWYNMADDYSVYQRGHRAGYTIQAIAKTSEEHQELYQLYKSYIHSLPPWTKRGSVSINKPRRPK